MTRFTFVHILRVQYRIDSVTTVGEIKRKSYFVYKRVQRQDFFLEYEMTQGENIRN